MVKRSNDLMPSVKKSLEKADAARIVNGLKVDVIEKKYHARYVGFYDMPAGEGPFLIFYADEPDRSKGHDNYFGIVRRGYPIRDDIYIVNAKSIREAEFAAIKLDDGQYLVSRYHHDYVTGDNGEMLDGGLAYTRCNASYPVTHKMTIVDGHEVFTLLPPRVVEDAAPCLPLSHDETLPRATLDDAKTFAAERHGAQRYADKAYTYHLDRVAQQLRDFEFFGYAYQASAWLHDVVEDTDTTIMEVVMRFGPEVGALVWSVTGIGKNRKARNADIYAKLAIHPRGCILKVADRLANHAASACDPATGLPNLAKARMYLSERSGFENVVRDHVPDAMWRALQESYDQLSIVLSVLTTQQ